MEAAVVAGRETVERDVARSLDSADLATLSRECCNVNKPLTEACLCVLRSEVAPIDNQVGRVRDADRQAQVRRGEDVDR